jgi:hypothetical protein
MGTQRFFVWNPAPQQLGAFQGQSNFQPLLKMAIGMKCLSFFSINAG